MRYSVDASICHNPDKALGREWLETNGRGGFACSTLLGANSRRYHSLLAMALDPPRHRINYVNKIEDLCYADGAEFPLSSNTYPGAIFPPGHIFLESFRLDPFPSWRWDFEGRTLEKSLFMPRNRDLTVVRYRSENLSAFDRLSCRLLSNMRDLHSIMLREEMVRPRISIETGRIVLGLPGLPSLFVYHNATAVNSDQFWYNQMVYQKDERRGFDHIEDVFSPLALEWSPPGDESPWIVLTLEDLDEIDPDALEVEERERRQLLLERTAPSILNGSKSPAPELRPQARMLAAVGERYLVRNSRGSREVIAGYPWLGCWGRDSFIAMEGLLLLHRRFQGAQELFRRYGALLSRGLVPTLLPDLSHDPIYQAADTSLWFVHAAGRWAAYQRDQSFLSGTLYPYVRQILTGYAEDATGLVRCGTDGLLVVIKADEDPTITYGRSFRESLARLGKPVEINALWHNALRVGAQLAAAAGDENEAGRWRELARACQISFRRQYPLPHSGRLADIVYDDRAPDETPRAFQLLAASLPFSPLSEEQRAQIMAFVEEQLLTPCGIRSLARGDEQYCSRFSGNFVEGMSAYYNGCAWPWMMGAYVDGAIAVGREQARPDGEIAQELLGVLQPLLATMDDAGAGDIREIFSGDRPHLPHGSLGMARNVAEISRALHRLTGML